MVRYCRLFNVCQAFSCKIEGPHELNWSSIKVLQGFSIISNRAVAIRIMISYSRGNFFPKESLYRKSVLSLHLDLKITFKLQYGKSFYSLP